ncbi:MAG: 50S ribosomal protein L25 [Clostridia bacterium]|nr:50S ribosomal protein L25 [Clostridia bacterium]
MKVLARDQKLKEVRNQDMIAGVLYGKGIDPVKVMVERKEFLHNFHEHGQVSVFACEFNGETHKVYIKDLQRDVMLPDKIMNFDLLKVSAKDKIHAKLPIHLLNKELLESKGFIVQQNVQEIDAHYSVEETPEAIEFDVANLDVGAIIKLEEISIPDFIDVHTDLNLVVLSVVHQKVKEEVEETEEVKEPILIGSEEEA